MILFRRCTTFLLLLAGGCITNSPMNPSFPVTAEQAQRVIRADMANPKLLKRPLVVIGGFLDPGVACGVLARDFKSYFHDDRIVAVSLGLSFSEDDYRRYIIDAVDKAFPTTDPRNTTEVDVIGYSMGGLAARYAAISPLPGRRLRIARLFTISSPHLGAVEAVMLPSTTLKIQQHMLANSTFLNAINNSPDPGALYPVYSYVCLRDRVVGEHNAAPPGQTPWWVSGPALFNSHYFALWDPRIRADILCRLRGDTPLSHDPPAPIPPQPFRR